MTQSLIWQGRLWWGLAWRYLVSYVAVLISLGRIGMHSFLRHPRHISKHLEAEKRNMLVFSMSRISKS